MTSFLFIKPLLSSLPTSMQESIDISRIVMASLDISSVKNPTRFCLAHMLFTMLSTKAVLPMLGRAPINYYK